MGKISRAVSIKIKAVCSVTVVAAFSVVTIATPVFAANTTVDASVTAGSQQDPHLEWTARTFPCNKYVKFVNTPGGVDTGDGSVGDPWQSLKRAFRLAQAGDFVCVEGGVYRENHLVPHNTGTWENPITFGTTGEFLLQPDLRPSELAEAQQPVIDFNNNDGRSSIGYWAIDRLPMDRQGQDGPGVQLLGAKSEPNNPNHRGDIHHIIIQNTKIINGKAGSGMLVRGRVHDVLLRSNIIENFQRWYDRTTGTLATTRVNSNYERQDAHGIGIEGMERDSSTPIATPQDPNPVATQASVERVYLDKNTFTNNGGDGVQCLGAAPEEAYASPSDPKNIDMVDTKIMNSARTQANQAIVENAFDIKSCQQVGIRGTAPTTTGGSSQGSKMKEFLPTVKNYDWGPTANSHTNNSDGAAIVVHYNARKVLVEYNRIWNACNAISVGRSDKKVNDVVIRRNMIFGLRHNQAQFDGSTDDALRCKGKAVQITNADNVDIHHNTIDDVPDAGIQVGDPNLADTPATLPNNVDIWNNIVRLSNTIGTGLRYWISLPKIGNNVDSDYNLFWHKGGGGADVEYSKHFRIGSTNHDLTYWRNTGQRDTTRATNLVWADPQFVADPLTNDYYTLSSSPARDGALNNVGAPACGTPDIGFLESCQP